MPTQGSNKSNSYRRDGERRGRRQTPRRISVRGELREQPDVQKIAGAVIALAMAQAEKEAQQQAQQAQQAQRTQSDTDGGAQ